MHSHEIKLQDLPSVGQRWGVKYWPFFTAFTTAVGPPVRSFAIFFHQSTQPRGAHWLVKYEPDRSSSFGVMAIYVKYEFSNLHFLRFFGKKKIKFDFLNFYLSKRSLTTIQLLVPC
jgi:hypothetical protein